MRRAWLALACIPLACLFPNVGDLEPGDAAPDVDVEAAGGDGGLDAPADVQVDAADGSDAGYCESLGGTHALCEDFDEGLFSAQFTTIHKSQAASLGSDGADFTSPPLSLVSTIPAKTGGGDQAYMSRAFGTASSATLSFDFRVDTWTGGANSAVFASIDLDDGTGTPHTLEIYLTDAYSALEETFAQPDGGTAFLDHTFSTTVPLGAWTRVSFSLDASAHTCTATVGGVQALAPTALDSSWVAGTVSIGIGLSYLASETNGWQARYDDVLFDTP